MIEKPEDRQIVKENCISMVQCKTIKQLELIEQKKFDDEDIQSDIEYLKEKMEESLQDLRLAILSRPVHGSRSKSGLLVTLVVSCFLLA